VKRKWIYVGITFTLAFFTKIVSIIFLPVFGLYIVNEIICRRVSKQELLYMVLAIVCTSLIVSSPIVLSGNLPGIVATHKGFFDAYESVSGNAYNIWVIFAKGRDLMMAHSSDLFFKGFTFQQVSMLLFIPFYALATWPLLWQICQNLRYKRDTPIKTEALLLVCVLVPLVFFYFSTKIRERYAHPYLVFLTLYCFYNTRYVLWFLATGIYLLQLEAVLEYTRTLPDIFVRVHEQTHLYSPLFISALFLTLILYLLHLSFVKMINATNKEKRVEGIKRFSVRDLTENL
jgi:small-conductance mechanosensitive channel